MRTPEVRYDTFYDRHPPQRSLSCGAHVVVVATSAKESFPLIHLDSGWLPFDAINTFHERVVCIYSEPTDLCNDTNDGNNRD